ncbi:GntR family transcriptional regulator [Amycolatopsis lurida]
MYLTVDLESDVPIYQQIRDRIVEAIARGEAKEGDVLPSTRRLAVYFGINFLTVGKAYDLLRRQGIIQIDRKSGAVIRRDRSTGPHEPDFRLHWKTGCGSCSPRPSHRACRVLTSSTAATP